MSAISVLQGRLTTEEGEDFFPYDDATGLRVRAPQGKISWGRGFNLEECGSSELFAVMEEFLLQKLDKQLQTYPWYDCDEIRQSVFLDIAYNAGLHGLLNFVHMLAYAEQKNWAMASMECRVANPKLDQSRYAPLRKLLAGPV